MPFKTVVTNRINPRTREFLNTAGDVIVNNEPSPWPRETLLSHSRDADAVMVFMTDIIDASFLEECPNLKIVAGALKGYNNLDVRACTDRSVLVTIVPDLLTQPTAELTIGLMISVARNFYPGEKHIREGEFNGWRPRFYGGSITGSTVGIIGAGAVGKAVMQMLNGFGCRKMYTDRHRLPPETERGLSAEYASLEQVRSTADFIVLALHLNDHTYHMVNMEFISRMKPGSYLINPARGSLVNESAVAEALEAGHLAGYAADTFEMEDWNIDSRPRTIHPKLLQSEKTVLLPHIGSAVTTVRQEIEQSAAESIASVSKGLIPDTAVNAGKIRASE